MSALLTNQSVLVETDLDRVIFTFGRVLFPLPYATVFNIASSLKMACKQAMRVTGERLENTDQHMQSDFEIAVQEVNPVRRNLPVEKIEWGITYNQEIVYLQLGNNILQFHFSDGLKISQWLRSGAAQAKRWAGETGKSMHTNGMLTDAEENYKRGYQ